MWFSTSYILSAASFQVAVIKRLQIQVNYRAGPSWCQRPPFPGCWKHLVASSSLPPQNYSLLPDEVLRGLTQRSPKYPGAAGGGNSCPSTQARRKSAERRWLGWLLWAHWGWATLPSTKSHPARLDTPSFLQLCRHHHHQTAPQRDNSRSCCCDKPSQRGVTRGFHLSRNHGGQHWGLGHWALSPAQASFLSQAVSWGKHLCFVSTVIPNNCIWLATGFHREVHPPKSTPCFSGKHIASDAQPHCLDQVILLLTPGKQSACPPFKVHHSNFKLIRSRGKKACLQDSFKPRLAPAILFSPALPKFFSKLYWTFKGAQSQQQVL